MPIDLLLLKLGMEMWSNPFAFDGFNWIRFDALLALYRISPVSVISFTLSIKTVDEENLFLLERLELADMIIWFSQLSTERAHVCHQWSTVLPYVTFQESRHWCSTCELLNHNYVRDTVQTAGHYNKKKTSSSGLSKIPSLKVLITLSEFILRYLNVRFLLAN